MTSKITLIGGGGLRTPLLIDGLARASEELQLAEVALFDVDRPRCEQLAALSRALIDARGSRLRVSTHDALEPAVRGARFVITSIRVGGIAARARDERLLVDRGVLGQETTGAGGMAMALRTIPVVVKQARLVQRLAPDAWLINFTNPAGLITQALLAHSGVRALGICDTPSDLFCNIAEALDQPLGEVACDYLGLNHLGWIPRVRVRGEDLTERLLADDTLLARLYPAPLFSPELIRGLRLIPSEYLFFYYEHARACANQRAADITRGEAIDRLNRELLADLSRLLVDDDGATAIAHYARYLQQRSASYLRLEAGSATADARSVAPPPDPFETKSGYHRVALDVVAALAGVRPGRIVINTLNQGAIPDLAEDDVVEIPARIDGSGVTPLAMGHLPRSVRGLVLAVKAYERLTIAAAMASSAALAAQALLAHPLIGDWQRATELTDALIAADPQHLGYLV